MNESHDTHVFCFAYSVHRLIRHALADTCTVSHSCREKRDAVSWTVRSPPVIIATRFCCRVRNNARMERETDENARDTRIIVDREREIIKRNNEKRCNKRFCLVPRRGWRKLMMEADMACGCKLSSRSATVLSSRESTRRRVTGSNVTVKYCYTHIHIGSMQKHRNYPLYEFLSKFPLESIRFVICKNRESRWRKENLFPD